MSSLWYQVWQGLRQDNLPEPLTAAETASIPSRLLGSEFLVLCTSCQTVKSTYHLGLKKPSRVPGALGTEGNTTTRKLGSLLNHST